MRCRTRRRWCRATAGCRGRDYEQRAARLAQALLDAGLGTGAKVGMYLYNSPEYCETNFAASQDPRRPDQRQLPLPRQRAALPARQRRRRGPGVPHLAGRSGGAGAVRAGRRAPADRGRRRPGARRHRPRRRRGGLRVDPRRDRAGGAHRRRRRRRVHLLHRRHDRDAEGRHVPDGRVHRVLPALVPADDRAGADRGRRRAAGDSAAACSPPAPRWSRCQDRR